MAVLCAVAVLLSAGPASSNGVSPSWIETYDGPGSWGNRARDVAVSPDGALVFVTGEGDAETLADIATLAYEAETGTLAWRRGYDGPGRRWDAGNALAVSPDGKILFVTGASHGGRGEGYDVATIGYDARTGAKLWVARFTGPPRRDADGSVLMVGPRGNRLFVGGRVSSADGADYLTLCYRARDGQFRWSRRYDGTANADDRLEGLDVAPGGSRVYVTGTSEGVGTGQDYVTLAYRGHDGARVWTRRFDGGKGPEDADEAAGVAATRASVIVTGTSWTTSNDVDYATVAYEAPTGARAWARRLDEGDSDHSATGIVDAPDGSRVFVTGTVKASSDTSYDFGTLAYEVADGRRAWLTRFDGPAIDWDHDVPADLAVSADGWLLVVTGTVGDDAGGASPFILTLALAAGDGSIVWGADLDPAPEGQDEATGVAVTADGSHVFVTGATEVTRGSVTSSDYLTVAYAPGVQP